MKPKGATAKIQLFGSFDPQANPIDKSGHFIKDPYYGGQDGFRINFEQVWRRNSTMLTLLQISRASEAFLKSLGY